jgi:hypothetical protein
MLGTFIHAAIFAACISLLTRSRCVGDVCVHESAAGSHCTAHFMSAVHSSLTIRFANMISLLPVRPLRMYFMLQSGQSLGSSWGALVAV